MTGLYETALYALSVGLQTTLFLTLGAALSRRVKSPARAYFLLVCLVVAATLLPFLTALVTTKFSFWQFTPRSADGPSVATRGAFYIALGVLTVGALRQAILLLGGMAQSRRLMFSARPLASPDLHGRLEKCLTLFQGKSFPVLFTSKRISHPSIWCWGLHPAILLPEELLYSATSGSGKRPVEGDRNNGCSDTLPEVIFLHELAHLIRRDHISGLLTRLGAVVLF